LVGYVEIYSLAGFVASWRRVAMTWSGHRLIIFGFLPQNSTTMAVAVGVSVQQRGRADQQADPPSLGDLDAFRGVFYDCLSLRRDVLFELTDAVLCAEGPLSTLVGLTLTAEHRRGHGAPYDGLSCGRVEVGRLRRSLAALPVSRDEQGRITLAVDVSAWLRPDAATSSVAPAVALPPLNAKQQVVSIPCPSGDYRQCAVEMRDLANDQLTHYGNDKLFCNSFGTAPDANPKAYARCSKKLWGPTGSKALYQRDAAKACQAAAAIAAQLPGDASNSRYRCEQGVLDFALSKDHTAASDPPGI
jgi:hypothetical protein